MAAGRLNRFIGGTPLRDSAKTVVVDSEAGQDDALVARRVSSAVQAAARFDSGVELASLLELLPSHGPATANDLAGWLRTHTSAGHLSGDRVHFGSPPDPGFDPGRRQRAEDYFSAASRLIGSELRGTRRWIRFLGVTGSTAYGDPREGDDCDIMAVVRPGSVWVFLTFVFLRLRVRNPRSNALREPTWCFNYTLDEAAAAREFSQPQGFHFAREALVARPLVGTAYYRGLLRRGDWLRREVPRLYARWTSTPLPEPEPPQAAQPGIRWVNALLFPVIAAYLQFKGMWTNHRLHRTGRADESFRTITRLDRMALVSRKYDELSQLYAPATAVGRRS